ncbi:TPA: CDP-alcohol phosphatidyltransferase family protein [Candidatus Bathyarchaeota archaeon]|nr:CDP-alcohol phosphatidyltransferase family protein [Candidatus Bathyarchaeota archaeon]
MLGRIKDRLRRLIAYEAGIAHSIGLSANAVSVIGVILAFAASLFYLLCRGNPLLILVATALLLSSGFCDALDGVLARMHGGPTPLGGFIDSLLDRYADASVIAAITVSGLCDLYVGTLALIGSLLVSYTRAKAEGLGVTLSGIGLVERSERILIVAASSIASLLYRGALWYGMLALAVLTHITVLQRALHTYRETT